MSTKFIASQFITIIMTIVMYMGLFQDNVTCFNIVKWYTIIIFVVFILALFCLKEHERACTFTYKHWNVSALLWGIVHCLMFFVASEYSLMLMDGYITYYALTNGKYKKE